MASYALRRALLQTSYICRKYVKKSGRRTILSDAHCCQNAWRERLQTPILQKVDIGEFAMRIQEKMDTGGVQNIDMDVLANKLESLDNQQLDFVQQLFYRFRHTNETLTATDSMSHAVVRALVHLGEIDRLLEILKDKINYGIFLDDFSASFLLDHLIKKEQYHEAAQAVYDLMLQEDLAHPVVRHLAWFACDKHWRSPKSEETQEEETAKSEEEDVWVPISFIRHPWYDDHWDMDRDSLLLGKSLVQIAQYEKGVLATSYRLLGLGVWEKFDRSLDLMDEWAADTSKPTVSREATDAFMSALEAVVTREDPDEAVDAGSMTMDDVRPRITAAQKDEFISRAKGCLSRLEAGNQVVDAALEPLLADKVAKMVALVEPRDVEDQVRLYRKWNEERQAYIQAQMDTVKNLEKREKIAQKIRYLQEREEKLSYFEDQEKILLGVSRAPKFKPIEDVQEEEQFVAPPTERGRTF